MLRSAAVCFVLALLAGALGYTGTGAAAEMARVLFFVFLILLIVFTIVYIARRRPPL